MSRGTRILGRCLDLPDWASSAFPSGVELRGVEVHVISQSGLEGKEAFPFGSSYATRLQPDPFRFSDCPAPAARGTCHKSNRTKKAKNAFQPNSPYATRL
jgi:hypothetical protein